MQKMSLQEALGQSGGPMELLWRPNAPAHAVPVVPPEIEGWRKEQTAWATGVAYFEMSHHMTDLVVEGPDAEKLLSYVSANNFSKFRVGQAKQFVAVSEDGFLIQDGIMTKTAEDRFAVIGNGVAANWLLYHASDRTYDARLILDPDSQFRGSPPAQFRFQVQGPKAMPLLERAFGAPLPEIKFFHFAEVSLAGKGFYALRHGMAGQPGFEFFGNWSDYEAIRDRIFEVGAEFGLVQVGGLAYFTTGVASGWLATPVPAIYTSESTAKYREFVSLYSYEGMNKLHGSFYSENVEDYYVSPYELGYGRSISFDHEFIGREALLSSSKKRHRKKVTLVWNSEDVANVFGSEREYFNSYSRDRVESDGELVGISEYSSYFEYAGRIFSIARVDPEVAKPGSQVNVVWGEHPGPGADAAVLDSFPRIRAEVQPAPIDEFARTTYRNN